MFARHHLSGVEVSRMSQRYFTFSPVEEIAGRVLANPVIESYRVEVEG